MRNALFITCYCHFKVISYITVLLSLNCKALHYFYITFTKITGNMDLVFLIDLVFNASHYTAGGDVVGIMTELGLRLTNVQYNGRSYGSWCNTFYDINTVSLGIEINTDCKKKVMTRYTSLFTFLSLYFLSFTENS